MLGAYDEQVDLTEGARIYGGFDCADRWTYTVDAPSSVEPMSVGVALRIETTERVVIEDFTFTAQDAPDPGASSIGALVVDSSDVTLRRATIRAGAGADGENGSGTMMRAATGAMGNGGTAACTRTTAANAGGAAVQSMCGGMASGSIGGKGGDGGLTRAAQGPATRANQRLVRAHRVSAKRSVDGIVVLERGLGVRPPARTARLLRRATARRRSVHLTWAVTPQHPAAPARTERLVKVAVGAAVQRRPASPA